MLEENEDKGMYTVCNIPLLLQDNIRCKYTLDKDAYNGLYIKLSETKQHLLDFVRVLSHPKNGAIIRDTIFRDIDTAVNFIDKKGTVEIAWENTLKAMSTVMLDKISTTKDQFTKAFTHIDTIKNHLSTSQLLEDKLCLFLQNVDRVTTYINSIDKQDNSSNTEYLRFNKQLEIILNKIVVASNPHKEEISETEDIVLLLSTLPTGNGYGSEYHTAKLNEKIKGFKEQNKLLQRYIVYINSLLHGQPENTILSNTVIDIENDYVINVSNNFKLADIISYARWECEVDEKYDIKIKDYISILKKELPIYKEHITNIISNMSKLLSDIKTDVGVVFISLLDKLAESFTSGDIKTITYLVNIYTATIDTVLSNMLCVLKAIVFTADKYNNLLYVANILQNILTRIDVLKPILKNDSIEANKAKSRIFTLDELKKVPLE